VWEGGGARLVVVCDVCMGCLVTCQPCSVICSDTLCPSGLNGSVDRCVWGSAQEAADGLMLR